MVEVTHLNLGGKEYHEDAQSMNCLMHKPKALADKESKCVVYFRGGGCVYGTAEHREEVCNKIAAMSNCIVINCN